MFYKGGKRTYLRTNIFKNKYCHFRALSPKREKLLLASCLSVYLSVPVRPNRATLFPMGGFS
jgi:hypothetical protein